MPVAGLLVVIIGALSVAILYLIFGRRKVAQNKSENKGQPIGEPQEEDLEQQTNLDSTRMALVNETIESEEPPIPSEPRHKQLITEIEELKDTINEQDALVARLNEQIERAEQTIESQLNLIEEAKKAHSDELNHK